MQALAKLLITDLWVSCSASWGGCLFVEVALPVLSIHDMRPGVPAANSLVFSTTDVATSGNTATVRSLHALLSQLAIRIPGSGPDNTKSVSVCVRSD